MKLLIKTTPSLFQHVHYYSVLGASDVDVAEATNMAVFSVSGTDGQKYTVVEDYARVRTIHN